MSNLLLVEDDADNARMMARMLRMRGFDVVLAADGATAVEMARQHLPDAIIMDLLLAGGMDGLEATRQIKEETSTKGIPVIVLPTEGRGRDLGWKQCPVEGIEDLQRPRLNASLGGRVDFIAAGNAATRRDRSSVRSRTADCRDCENAQGSCAHEAYDGAERQGIFLRRSHRRGCPGISKQASVWTYR